MSDKKRAILKELAKRAKKAEEIAARPQFSVEEFCFDKQLSFVRDSAKFKTAVCSRRAGKSIACIADMYDTARKFPGVNVVYITLNRRSAKRIIWRELVALVEKYEEEYKIDNTELSITLDNNSTIYLSGADDEGEIDKFRGLAIKKVYIDEAQSFRSYIRELVNDVLVPALYDYDGSMILIGTPGPVPNGYFYEATQNQNWSHHHWTIFDNPHIEIKSGKKASIIVSEANARRGIDEKHPTHLRENMGLWVNDTNALVFAFNQFRNVSEKIPDQNMEYIFGIDIGWVDSDAIAVVGYNSVEKICYLVEEHVQAKQTISDLVAKIRELQHKYKPIKMVMDAGALGKKIQEEILQRYGLFIEAAEKHRKLEFIELMNDDLRTGRLKTYKGSRFEEDCYHVEWDRSNPEKPRISDRYHTDIGDSVLYSWRECRHYLSEKPVEPVRKNTNEWMQHYWEEEAEKMARKKRGEVNIDDLAGSQEDMDSLVEGIVDTDEF